MPLEQALECRVAAVPAQVPSQRQAVPPPSNDSLPEVLTPREREVVALIGRGLSNRQIAEALVISEATATVHVKHILAKLGFGSRVQVAAWGVSRQV